MTLRRCPSCGMLNESHERDSDDVCILCRPGDPPWWRVKEARASVVTGRYPWPRVTGESPALGEVQDSRRSD